MRLLKKQIFEMKLDTSDTLYMYLQRTQPDEIWQYCKSDASKEKRAFKKFVISYEKKNIKKTKLMLRKII